MSETVSHGVGPDQAPDQIDTSPTPEDGPQNVTDDFGYEEAESDDVDEADEDPQVGEVWS